MAQAEKDILGDGKAYRATHRFAPISSRKARYVVDLVRGLPVNAALERLRFCPRRASPMVTKVLQSAIANAGQDAEVDANRLFVADARADDGPIMPRGKPRSRGQWFPLKIRLCHISVQVREMPEGALPGAREGRRRRAAGAGGRKAAGKAGGGTDDASGQES